MIHISFSILGLICFITPFIQFYIYKDKVWCKYVCPRAGYFNVLIGKINIGLKPPKFFNKIGVKKAVVTYFGLNLFFITMSTIMVALARINPIEEVRFLIIFSLPGQLPQLLDLVLPSPLIHLGYRVYSMMFSSVVVGTIIGILYRPRSWCVICPVNTLTSKSKV